MYIWEAMSELKPCPFCGSIPEVYDSETDDIREEDAHWVSVCCRKCGAEPFRHIYSDNVNEDTKQAYRDKCISKWNTRTRADLTDALAEAAEEAKQQIEYLHGKFQETGTGNAVIARLQSALAAYRGEK